jgi:NADH-quinone oxidoreductase subunit H
VGIPLTNIRLAGFGQFIADGIKSLTKEDIVPRTADKVVHFLAPIALLIPVLLTYSVLPFGRNMVPLDLKETGLLFFFALGASTELSVFMAGWSSRNKYSLLGAMRAIAQMVSYEIPLILSALTVVMMAGTLSLNAIVENQEATFGPGIHKWHLFTPWGFVGFFLFLTAAAAEANRTPFDLPEAESEIIAGYFTEYSGFKFAIFFLAEYLGLFAMCGLGITLFLGGWLPPLNIPPLTWIPSWCWFLGKLSALIVLFIWLRGTLPRLRTDQLMGFAWKFLLPMTLINLVVAALWHLLRNDLNTGVRWLLCFALLAVPYWLLGRGFEAKFTKREYRFAS